MSLADNVEPGVVRSLLKLSLDETALPDGVIKSPVYAGRAATEIGQRVADAESRANDQHIKNALNLLTAALIAEADIIPNLTSVVDQDVGRTDEEPTDWPALGAKRRAGAYQEIALALGQTDTLASRRSSMAVGHRSLPRHLLRTLRR